MKIIETPWRDHLLLLADVDTSAITAAFSDSELAVAADLRLEKRRAQWLASRYAVKRLALDLGICRDLRECRFERPYLVEREERTPWHVSVSHSGRYVAAAIARTSVGTDIEVVRPVSPRAAHFFLSEDEIEQMNAAPVDQALLHFWCAKEAAWKQRSDEFTTLRQVQLALHHVRSGGLQFDSVETVRIGDVILALTR